MKILKYELAKMERQCIKMPAGAQILSAQEQHELIVLWALAEPGINEIRRFACFFTGRDIEPYRGLALHYIDTVQLHHGNTVVHVFEEK